MKLNNPFSEEIRLIDLYTYYCYNCNRSDQGLELHHITGRDNNSALNAIPICKICHAIIGHSQEEEKKLFNIRLRKLKAFDYKLKQEDLIFLENHKYLCQNNKELMEWLKSN